MPSDDQSQASLIRAEAAPTTAGGRHRSWTHPPDLLREAVRRLRASALLYAGAYFLAGLLPALLIPEARAMFFTPAPIVRLFGELAPAAPLEEIVRMLRVTLLSCPPMTQDSGRFLEIERLFAAVERILAEARATVGDVRKAAREARDEAERAERGVSP